jgi:hypothetical protein
MGFFKTKEEKDFENKQKAKNQIREFEKRIVKLESQLKVHVQAAKDALKEGLIEQVNFAKTAITRTIQERKMVIRMKINFEIFNQLKDQAEANKQFLQSIKLLTVQLGAATKIDAQKIFNQFDAEVDKANEMVKEVQSQLNDQEGKFNKTEVSEIAVTDKDIEALIYGSAQPTAAPTNTASNVILETNAGPSTPTVDPIEQKLNELKKKLEKK